MIQQLLPELAVLRAVGQACAVVGAHISPLGWTASFKTILWTCAQQSRPWAPPDLTYTKRFYQQFLWVCMTVLREQQTDNTSTQIYATILLDQKVFCQLNNWHFWLQIQTLHLSKIGRSKSDIVHFCIFRSDFSQNIKEFVTWTLKDTLISKKK